jgi:hypothetical protein
VFVPDPVDWHGQHSSTAKYRFSMAWKHGAQMAVLLDISRQSVDNVYHTVMYAAQVILVGVFGVTTFHEHGRCEATVHAGKGICRKAGHNQLKGKHYLQANGSPNCMGLATMRGLHKFINRSVLAAIATLLFALGFGQVANAAITIDGVTNSQVVSSQLVTITEPSNAGTAPDDLLVAHISVYNGVSVTPPANWVQVFSDANAPALAVYYLTKANFTGGPYVFTAPVGNNVEVAGSITRYSGVDTAAPVDPLNIGPDYVASIQQQGTPHPAPDALYPSLSPSTHPISQ